MSMPRSLADRSSLSRGSVITGRSDAISVGSAVTRHWVNSVSDIYGPDEIEELLEDLNRLEMASFDGVMMFDNIPTGEDSSYMRPTSSEMNIMQNEAVISGCITQPPDDDVEDFDIDGSQVKSKARRQQFDGGGPPTASVPEQSHPHATANDNSASSTEVRKKLNRHRRGSSSWSVRSWDSHAHYQDFHNEDDEEDETEGGLFPGSRNSSAIVCYCDMSTFKTPRTILRVLLVVTSIACLSTVLTAGTAKMGLFALPHFPRLRIMMFITVFTVIFTIFVLFLNISHLYTFLPVDYGKMQTVAYLLLTVAYALASTLVFQSHTDDTPSLPKWTKIQTLIIALLGFTCAFETLLCSFNCGRPPMNAKTHYDKMAESSTHFTLHETLTTTNQSRAVTDDSLQQKSAASKGTIPPQSKQQQYLVNENYQSKLKVAGQSNSKNGSGVITKATVESNSASLNKPLKSTGAIPKQKVKVNKHQNHLDEIVSLPLDDLNVKNGKK